MTNLRIRPEHADGCIVNFVQSLATARGARTMAIDRQTHKAYLVTAKFGPPPAATAEQPHPRPSIQPGTFEVIVVGKP